MFCDSINKILAFAIKKIDYWVLRLSFYYLLLFSSRFPFFSPLLPIFFYSVQHQRQPCSMKNCLQKGQPCNFLNNAFGNKIIYLSCTNSQICKSKRVFHLDAQFLFPGVCNKHMKILPKTKHNYLRKFWKDQVTMHPIDACFWLDT